MIKTLAIASLVAAGFAGSALATESHRRAPADAADYYASYDHRPAVRASADAPVAREDFGSFGAGSTARNLGY